MPEFPDTRVSLLARIQSPRDEEAWREFTSIYRPVVYRFARKRGLQDADAEDLTQHVLVAVQGAIRRFQIDPAMGRFRSWLARVARNAIINALTRRRPDAAAGGSSIQELLQQQPEPELGIEETLQREYRRSLFRWAAEQIKPEFREGTWEAFWLTTAEGMSVEDASRRLGKGIGAIYAARSRVMRRLKEEIQRGSLEGSD